MTFVQEVSSNEHGVLLISDYVFQETVNVVLRKSGLAAAIEVGEFLLEADHTELVFASDDFFEHWRRFQNQDKAEAKSLSLVDASLLSLAGTYDGAPIATFDKGFDNLEGVNLVF